MTKATNTEVKDFGFTPEMFQLADAAALDDYIDTLLTDIALQVEDKVGSTIYDSPTAVQTARLKKAETYLCAAELYRRREVFVHAEADTGGREQAEAVKSLYLQRAQEFEGLAETELGRVNSGYPGSGVATGYTETGPYTAST